MAAKKKAAKKSAKKVAKKPVRKAKKSTRAPKTAGTVEVVQLPVVDVTKEVKQDVVAVPAPKPVEQKTTDPAAAQAKHEEFTQALKEEPPKKGFFARLFGRK